MAMNQCEREFDFALVLSGISEITREVEDALFEAGCDDATLSMRHGRAYLTFSRTAITLGDAILSAIESVHKAKCGAKVERVDMCDLVTMSEIAERIGRTRSLVWQYVGGTRGPGGFPGPACNVADRSPFWYWCEVAYWLRQNDMIKEEELTEARELAAINSSLEYSYRKLQNPEIAEKILRLVAAP